MYIVLKWNKPLSWEKFSSVDDAKTWCLHNGYARLKRVNDLGDVVIILKDGIILEKIS